MWLMYSIGISFYWIVVKIATATGNEKAKKWISGRRDWKKKLDEFVKNESRPIIWVHAASLGEFEQGRPLMERIKQDKPGCSIALTFFSPSGYEVRKNYSGADFIAYLPLDTSSNARYFVAKLKPQIVVFIKYEFWFNYIKEIKNHNIPLYSVSGIFRESQTFFKWYGGFFRSGLKAFSHLFVQDQKSKELLGQIDITDVTVAGDTRFDRVSDIKKAAVKIADIEQFTTENTTVIVGSSWSKEEAFLRSFLITNFELSDCNFIIAPHNIDNAKIQEMAILFGESAYLYSKVKGEIPRDCRILIIDSIGLLSSIYAYSDITIIGGGFGAGIHNVLEAAIWSQPVIFGPNYKNFKEAVDLVAEGSAFVFSDQNEFDLHLLNLIENRQLREEVSRRAGQYCAANTGAVELVLKEMNIS